MFGTEVGWFFKLIANFGCVEFAGSTILLKGDLKLSLLGDNLILFALESFSEAKRVLILGSSLF